MQGRLRFFRRSALTKRLAMHPLAMYQKLNRRIKSQLEPVQRVHNT
jgi:hypothetical protein